MSVLGESEGSHESYCKHPRSWGQIIMAEMVFSVGEMGDTHVGMIGDSK